MRGKVLGGSEKWGVVEFRWDGKTGQCFHRAFGSFLRRHTGFQEGFWSRIRRLLTAICKSLQ